MRAIFTILFCLTIYSQAIAGPNPKLNYSAQLGYLPNGRNVKLHITFGVSAYL
ncbi:MAG: hypothetical protein NT018_13080 [Armatimonadetes bacterium]|nr:hypothetical protein [Armatimonadota bacterium]